jgi:hypothetical protein
MSRMLNVSDFFNEIPNVKIKCEDALCAEVTLLVFGLGVVQPGNSA